MEHLYNPASMSEQEIKDTFVARQALIDRLVGLVRRQPEGAGVQHVVLVGPRGMGKTTLLLMMQFAVTDRGLAPPWLAVQFPEELYGVSDLADLWLETLDSVARGAGDAELPEATERLKVRYPVGEQLQEAALALLRDWCRRHGRRLLLLIDNFDMIFSQINDEQQNAALRRVLMNEGFLMILGAAPSFFKEASRYDEPLYNFFQIERLERLTFEDIQSLLRQRAAADGLTDFEKTLDANKARLRVLQYFTGGNARLVLMLYRIITRSDASEVRRGLELLLDQVTPYYKDKTEALPAQQRKILDHIARASGQTHEGISPTEIAKAVRLTAPVVSAQLKRLTEQGYVHPANLRGRSTFYTLSEPLYSLWYQMRFGRDTRQRMAWLVSFLKEFYSVEELDEQSRLLESRFHSLLTAGREHDARNALEHRRWIAEALPDRVGTAKVMESVIQGYLTLKDYRTIEEQRLAEEQLKYFTHEVLDQLVASQCINADQAAKARQDRVGSEESQLVIETQAALRLGFEAVEQENFSKALLYFDYVLTHNDHLSVIWSARGDMLYELGRYEEALASYDHALELHPADAISWLGRGDALVGLHRLEDALNSCDQAVHVASALNTKLQAVVHLSRFMLRTALGWMSLATEDWHAAVKNGIQINHWVASASRLILAMSQSGHRAFIRELIASSHTEDKFFPLARALDYLASGDAALIEKLTPEMRPIVEEVVAKLRPAQEAEAVP